MSDPIFPPEIEYIIFTNALAQRYSIHDDRHEDISHLLLVAKRIHAWLIPIIMRTVVIQTFQNHRTYPRCIDLTTTSNLQKYGHHIRNLFLFTTDIANRLSYCPNTIKLLLWMNRTFHRTELIQLARLEVVTHLSIDFDDISQGDSDLLAELKVLFSRITHLEVITIFRSMHPRTILQYFTSLTHLSVLGTPDEVDSSSILAEHPALQVLVLQDGGGTLEVLDDDKVDDPRVVVMSFGNEQDKEWLCDVEDGRGLWGLADKALRQRKETKEAIFNGL